MWLDVTDFTVKWTSVWAQKCAGFAQHAIHWRSFYVTEWEDVTESTLNLGLIWQFIGWSWLLRITEAVLPKQMQEGSILLCISVAAGWSRGSMSQGLAKGSHGIWLLTPRQLYSQPGAHTEWQWGYEQDCKHQSDTWVDSGDTDPSFGLKTHFAPTVDYTDYKDNCHRQFFLFDHL